MLVAALLGPISKGQHDPHSAAADEWLYVVGGHADADANGAHNRAFDHLARCELELCDSCLPQAREEEPLHVDDATADDAFKHSPPQERKASTGVADNLTALVATLRRTHGAAAAAGGSQSRMRRSYGPVSTVVGFWDSFLRPE
jgi:hypothetical protein